MKYGIKITSLTNPPKQSPYWGEALFPEFSDPRYHKSDGSFIVDDLNMAFIACNTYRSIWYGDYKWGFTVEERE